MDDLQGQKLNFEVSNGQNTIELLYFESIRRPLHLYLNRRAAYVLKPVPNQHKIHHLYVKPQRIIYVRELTICQQILQTATVVCKHHVVYFKIKYSNFCPRGKNIRQRDTLMNIFVGSIHGFSDTLAVSFMERLTGGVLMYRLVHRQTRKNTLPFF